LAKRRKTQGRPHAAKKPTYNLLPNRTSAVIFSPWNQSRAPVTGAVMRRAMPRYRRTLRKASDGTTRNLAVTQRPERFALGRGLSFYREGSIPELDSEHTFV
jgi:hypothetical protein